MSEKVAEWEKPVRGEEVSDEEKVRFRSVAALLNFIGPDRSDMQYPLKEVLRAVSCPGVHDITRIKRILRYLINVPRLATLMPWEGDLSRVIAYVDSDFAGCRSTRKSTCGGCLVWGGGAP